MFELLHVVGFPNNLMIRFMVLLRSHVKDPSWLPLAIAVRLSITA
jgi:hypothetical protein